MWGASIGVCRLPFPGELGGELAETGSRGVYASLSSVSGLLTTIASGLSTFLIFALHRPSADDEDLRGAGLDGTEADTVTGGGDEDTGGSGRVAWLIEARGRRFGELIVARRCGGKSDRVGDFLIPSVHK